MKYASAVINLMAAYPGRQFKVQQICRFVCPAPKDVAERRAVRIGVHRVLVELKAVGSVLSKPPAVKNGGYALYWWRDH